MRHKTVERLVERVLEKIRKDVEARLWAQPDDLDLLNTVPGIHVTAHYRAKGRSVWSVEYTMNCWFLRHYGTVLLSYNELTGEVYEWVDTISVSDQQGMNGFLNALGVDYYVGRAGRTARYV